MPAFAPSFCVTLARSVIGFTSMTADEAVARTYASVDSPDKASIVLVASQVGLR